MMEDGVATILVVEDEPMLRKLADKVLTKAGFRVILAVDGADALAKFEEHQAEIDLVMLDLTLPVVPGEDVLRNLLARDPAPRILVSTGAGYVPVTQENGEPLPLVPKPWTPTDLVQQVNSVLAS